MNIISVQLDDRFLKKINNKYLISFFKIISIFAFLLKKERFFLKYLIMNILYILIIKIIYTLIIN